MFTPNQLWDHAQNLYGTAVNSRRYQAFRFLEEACELAQAEGLSEEDCLNMVRYVMSRPKGDSFVEAGDVQLTLAILLFNAGIAPQDAEKKAHLRFAGLDPLKARLKDTTKIAAGLI